jgi:small multidrug resistance pump
MNSWFLLVSAIVFEVGGTTSMKLSEGFTKLAPSVAIFLLYSLSFISLTYAIKRIDLAVAYAIWSGLGTALVAVVGFLYFGEAFTLFKVASLGLIVAGVYGLHLSGGIH